ncbi:MAG: response regulator [Bacteroidales bacterium]|nr:response regulator [Bacteroidales bacterium]
MNQPNKILIADDSESYLRIIQQIFEIVGHKHELYFARDGKSACDLAIQHLPDLIILDVIMPEMNGIDAAKILRNNHATQHIPIIMLSATESLKSAYEVGANDFISKPFNQYELLIKVRSALNLVEKIKEANAGKKIDEEKLAEYDQLKLETIKKQEDSKFDLKYSARIQRSILPRAEQMAEILDEYFILNLPRNIVSGDFYWIGRHNNMKVVAAIDCTGHEIAGALMTMAGMAFLNDILGGNKSYTPGQVLAELRKMVMNLLRHTGEEGEASDGMDVSIAMIDNANSKLYFAGANNPIYIVQNNQLIQLKGDRMPIGVNLNFQREFEDSEIGINEGDSVYLFSDGYADQFGGPGNKKFRYKQFQDLLLEIHQKPLFEQKEILQRTFLGWKGNYPQIDDVLVIGFKIK